VSDWEDDLTRYKHPGNIAQPTLQGMAGFINSRHPGAIQHYTKLELEPEDCESMEDAHRMFQIISDALHRQSLLPENQGKIVVLTDDYEFVWVAKE
jgi:hypothetical protein